MITLTIKMASLLSDIKVKSHMNTARIKDADDQYAVRAGEENEVELRQDLQDAWRELLSICRRFLPLTSASSGDDTFDSSIATTDKSLTLDFKETMPQGVIDSLAQAAHEYLMSGALCRFYTSAAMPDLAALYSAQETATTVRIRELIFYRPMP